MLIVIGLVLRLIVSFLVVLGNGFTIKEMLLVAVAWLPKATVQVWKYIQYGNTYTARLYMIKECMYGTFDCQNSHILYTANYCLKSMEKREHICICCCTNEWLCSCNLVSVPLGISVVPVYIPLEPSHCFLFYHLYFVVGGVAGAKFDYKILCQFPPGCHWLICFGNGYGQK